MLRVLLYSSSRCIIICRFFKDSNLSVNLFFLWLLLLTNCYKKSLKGKNVSLSYLFTLINRITIITNESQTAWLEKKNNKINNR